MLSRCVSSRWLLLALSLAIGVSAFAQDTNAPTAYFVDGYHGGVYGHYPTNFTRFIVDSLRAHPDWKLNLEIEPETWDVARTNTPGPYAELVQLAADQSTNGRIEFINPAYAQSYLWNLCGESVIQQFTRGMAKIREHFTNAVFSTYSSEEPCFTSALPGILKSLGFQNAVLKNPNTCWGGYTRAHGGELVHWIGPDGTGILTVPRYQIENLSNKSTWETIGNANSPAYIHAALAAGIEHPVGMCIQDAGWRFGPWLDHVGNAYQPTQSTLWRNYFANIANPASATDWHFSQEDVQVSLVWGSQVLQRIAQEVRHAENKIVSAEKMAVLAHVYAQTLWPSDSLDEAWRTLLLSQHHDCWIVSYNGPPHNTWADKVARWTGNTSQRSDDVIHRSASALVPATNNNPNAYCVSVFNTLGHARTEVVTVPLPDGWDADFVKLTDSSGYDLPTQSFLNPRRNGIALPQEILFTATCPAFGLSNYKLEKIVKRPAALVSAVNQSNGLVQVDTDLYHLVLDPQHGGVIKSLIDKKHSARELVDPASPRAFNELRGYFFQQGQFYSTADTPATIETLQDGPLRTSLLIHGQIQSNNIIQIITLTTSQPRIDFFARIDWQDKPGIGSDHAQSSGYRAEDSHKAFYEDRYKLQAQFPLNFPHQKIFKDAPFDVTESHLTDTYFQNWSDIKNNSIVNWVDDFDPDHNVGVALLTDHTTSYDHGPDDPLALTVQYSGIGLWGRNYDLRGSSEIHYALLPHAGNWEQADVWNAAQSWNEPLIVHLSSSVENHLPPPQSLLTMDGDPWDIPTARVENGVILIRLFNPHTTAQTKTLHYQAPASQIDQVQLNGELIRHLTLHSSTRDQQNFSVTLPPFGIGTLRITP